MTKRLISALPWMLVLVAACGTEGSAVEGGEEEGSPASASAAAVELASLPALTCGEMDMWIADHAASLPRDHAGLSLYPPQYQRAIFGAVAPEVRSAMWIGHIESYIDEHPELDDRKQEILAEAIDLATPALFSVQNGDPRWGSSVDAPLRAFEQRALTVFTSDEYAEIFTQIVAPPMKTMAAVAQPATPDCACSIASDWCGKYMDCRAAECKKSSWGCGNWLSYACDGMCFNTLIEIDKIDVTNAN